LVGVLDKLNWGTVSVAIEDVRRDTKWHPVLVPCRAGTRSVTITRGMTLITNGLRTMEVDVGRSQWVEIHAKPRVLRWPRVWIE
jgi:hypothetical protein